jgi:hypothetical protein
MDQQEASMRQLKAVSRCQDPIPIPAEEGRILLADYAFYTVARRPEDMHIVIARVSHDQNVRLQLSNERLSRWLIGLTWALVALTIALVGVGIWPLFQHK